MEMKTIASVTVACYNLNTNLIKLKDAVGVMPAKLMDEIRSQGIEPTGPQIWHYQGCDGDPATEFLLKICFPVNKVGINNNEITFETLGEFKSLSAIHNGPWSEFQSVYENLIGELLCSGYEMNGLNREIYLHCDFENQNNCVTEIQIGIK